MAHEVFISYKAEEYAEASWVKSVLEENRISCWLAPGSIPGGSSYADEIDGAIRECRALVLILSDGAQQSKWIKKELDIALNYGKVILPFMIENVRLQKAFNFYLTDVQRYTAYADKVAAMREMIRRIEDILGRTEAQPAEVKPFYERDLIAKVASIGGNDINNPLPAGIYSARVKIKKYKCIFFHVFLRSPIGYAGEAPFVIRVYDDLGNLVSDLTSTVACQPIHDKFAKGMVLRGDDGTSLERGKYSADVSIDGCKPVRYCFELR